MRLVRVAKWIIVGGCLISGTSAFAEGASVILRNCDNQTLTMQIDGTYGCTADPGDRCSSAPRNLGPHDLTASDGNGNVVWRAHIELGPNGFEWTVGGGC